METEAFYSCLRIMNKKGIALLMLSDNSQNNKSLIAKAMEDKDKYNYVRSNALKRIIE